MQCMVGTIDDPHLLDADLVLVFGTRSQLEADDHHRLLAARFPQALIAGCSTAGQFAAGDLVDEHPICTSIRFDHTQLALAVERSSGDRSSEEIGRKLGATLAHPDLRAVLVLSEGTTCNGTALVAGLEAEIGSDVTIFGGLAADGSAFETTMVMANESRGADVVAAIGFVGDRFRIATGSEGGWEIFGPERTITAASGSVLHELDGERALELYSRYLGDRASELPGSALLFPLSIHPPDSPKDTAVVRTILGVDEANSSMTFAGDMPVGWKAQLMRASFDALIDGAEHAGAALRELDVSGDLLCVGVSCVGRRLVLGQRSDEELDAVLDQLPAGVAFTGFYSYGELAPGRTGGCELHNQTMTLALIGEA